MTSIYEQISGNKRKTVFIIIGFVAFITSLGYFFGEYFVGAGAGYTFLLFALIFSSVSAFSSYYFSDKVVLSISGAKEIKREDNSVLYGMLENLCVGLGIKQVPKLYLIDDTAPNAFATGRNPDHAAVAVTKGLLMKLDKRQLEGVLAHELSHVKNYDILVMTITVVLVGTVTMIANIMLHSRFSSRDDKRAGSIILIVGLVLALLSPIIAELIKLAVSRSREYLADASAALLTRDPEGLAEALEIIASDREPLEVANEATAHLYISNPLIKGKNADFFANLFSTHPPVEERIKRLRSM